MSDPNESLNESATRIKAVADGLAAWWRGSDTTSVNNGNEDLPSPSNLLRQLRLYITTNVASLIDAVAQAVGAANVATGARDVATNAANTATAQALSAGSSAAVAQQIALFTSSSALDSKAAQTVALPANTYNNGTLGVGATLTANANGALTTANFFDGVTINVGDTVLIRLEAAGHNWLYTFTQQGTASLPWIFTRLPASDTADEIGNAVTNVLPGGALYGSTKWRVDQAAAAITVGTTQLTFSTQSAAVAAESAARVAGDTARDGALLISTYPGLGRLAIVDSQMNLLGYFSIAGLDFSDINSLKNAVAALQAIAATLPGFDSPPGSGTLSARDSSGNLGWQITPSKVDHPDTNAVRSAVGDLLAAEAYGAIAPAGGVMHVITVNQSLGLGTSSGPVLSPNPVPGGLIFANALRILDSLSEDPANWGSFAPLFERSSPFDASLRETHSSGMVQRINERLTADYGVNLTGLNQSVLTTIIGSGGISVQELLQTPYKERLTNTIIKGASESAIAGKSYNPLAVVVVQGEANQATPAETFYSLHKQLYDNAVAQANISRGGNRPMAWITYQTSSYPQGGWVAPFAAEAYLYIQERNQFGVMACPIYPFAYADGLHLLASGYKTMGGYFGDAFYELLFKRYRRPVLRPTIERLNSKTLGLRYKLRPGARLVHDPSITARDGVTLAQKGIRVGKVDDLAFAMPTEIAGSVNVVGPDCIEFAAASTIPSDGSYEVKTGWYGSTSRNYTELRDNSGDLIPTFDPLGLNVKLHTWFPISRTTIYV